MGEMKACKKCLSQESLQLAASILNVSTTDLYEILQEGVGEVSSFKDFSKKGIDEKMPTISLLEEKDLQVKTEISLCKVQYRTKENLI